MTPAGRWRFPPLHTLDRIKRANLTRDRNRFFAGQGGVVRGKSAAMFLAGLFVLSVASTRVDARLDRLILEERFSEAFGEAVDELGVRLAARGDRDPETIA